MSIVNYEITYLSKYNVLQPPIKTYVSRVGTKREVEINNSIMLLYLLRYPVLQPMMWFTLWILLNSR